MELVHINDIGCVIFLISISAASCLGACPEPNWQPLGGAVPFSYCWLGKELVIDQHEGAVRKLMYELFAEKKKTISGIRNEKGLRMRNGSKFTDTRLDRLLRDRWQKGNEGQTIPKAWDRRSIDKI